jgi:hypothetical protein
VRHVALLLNARNALLERELLHFFRVHLRRELRELRCELPLERRDLRVRLLRGEREAVFLAPQLRVRRTERIDGVGELGYVRRRGVALRAACNDVRLALVEARVQEAHRRVEAVHVRALLRRQRAQRRVLRREPRDLSVELGALLFIRRLDRRDSRLGAALLRQRGVDLRQKLGVLLRRG